MPDLKCSTCFDVLDIQAIYAGSCGHTFHHHCILKWMNGTKCAICRSRFTKNSIIKLFFNVATPDDTLPISPSLQNELDSKNAELKAKVAELASSLKKVKDLQDHAATTEQMYNTMHQKYLATQSELESLKLRMKKLVKLETKIENLERKNAALESQLIDLSNIQTVLHGTQHEAEEILRQQGILVAQEVGRSSAKNMANLCSILKRELFKLRAYKSEQKKKETELLLQLGIKTAKLKKMQQYQETLQRRNTILSASRSLVSVSYLADVSTSTEDEHANPLTSVATEGELVKKVNPIADDKNKISASSSAVATESELVKNMTPIADGKNKASASSSINGGGNLHVTPIPYNFSDKKRPTMKKVVLDKPATQSISFINPVNHFPKPILPPFNRKFDDNDSITRVGYNGLGGHERVIFPRARELANTKPYKKNPNVKKGK